MSDSAALHHVLKNRSRAEIFGMLQQMVNLECTYENGDTVYHVILRNGNLNEEDIIAISQFFHDRKVNPNTRNKKVIAPLHLAIERRMICVAEFFWRCRKPNVSKPNHHTFTLFFVEDEKKKFWQQVNQNCNNTELWSSEKIENESARFLEWLISRELDFDRDNDKQQNAVNLAVFYSLHHISHILLGRTTNLGSNQPAHALLQRFLCCNGYSRKRSSHNKNNKLWYSAYTSRYTAKIVKILIGKGALNSYWTNNTKLAIGGKEDITIIKMLFDHFPDNCVRGGCASSLLNDLMGYPCVDLSVSEIDIYLQILKLLLAKGADLRKDQEKKYRMIPVQEAVKANNIHAVRWLDEVGTDFNVLGMYEQNLLHILASQKENKGEQHTAVFDFLISKGCQVNAKQIDGTSPLHLAAENENVALVKKLIELKADINCRDGDLQSPLHFAVMYNETTEIAEFLLKNGANVHAKDNKGWRTLHLIHYVNSGSRERKLSMVKLLLKYGAQVNELNEKHNKIIGNSTAHNMSKDIIEEFLKYGLDINGSQFCNVFCYSSSITSSGNSIFEQHRVKLKTAQLPYGEYTMYEIHDRNDRAHQKWYEDCLREIETLKTTFIDSHTSLYDYLHMNLESTFIHINNEKLKRLVDSPALEEQFPQYSVLILASYRKAVARKSFLKSARVAWLELTDIGLPEICIELIVAYLNNTELLKMIGE